MKKSNTILCAVIGLFSFQVHADGDILVRYKNSIPHVSVMPNAAATIQSALGRAAVVSMRQMATDPTVHVVSIDQAADVSKAIAALKRNPDVEVAEENIDIELYDQDEPAGVAVPNDAEFAKQWGMLNTGQTIGGGWTGASAGVAGADINVSPLWAAGITGSRDIIVAVIDTGVDGTHPDLKDNIFVNKGEIPGNGIDDDHNGFVDDVSGWNFVKNTNQMIDDHSHGTHCAGVIGASGNDGHGVVGVNWKVRILPVKIFDGKGGGKLEVAVNAINYATMMGARVMSNSWGWKGSGKEKSGDRISINSGDGGEDIAKVSTLMREAIKKAGEKGALFVAAAGNSRADNDSTPHFPSSYKLDNIVSVAALDNKDKLASFSCYGKNSVHVGAPGVDVYSTVPGGKFQMMSGTSMATPHVSGIAALALSHNPSLTYQELKARMISTSTPIPALAGKFQAGGRINAEKVVRGL